MVVTANIFKETVHIESVAYIESMGDSERTQPRLRYFHNIISNLKLTKSMKAVLVLEEEMSKEKGFTRHNGESYFVHPIAVAQTAIDFGLVDDMIRAGEHNKADVLISSCLLHDIIEDVEGYDYTRVSLEFGEEVAKTVMCVTKVDGEKPVDYLKRFTSTELSSLVKVLDQLNNVATLSESSWKHRDKIANMAEEVYLPLLKHLRQRDWIYGRFYFQVRTIIATIIKEVRRSNDFEEKLQSHIEVYKNEEKTASQ